MSQPNWKVHYGVNEQGLCVSIALPQQDPSSQHWRLRYTGKGWGVRLALEFADDQLSQRATHVTSANIFRL